LKKHAESKKKTKFAQDKKYAETAGPQFFYRSRLLNIFIAIYNNCNPRGERESLRRTAVLLPLVRADLFSLTNVS
jgi:hypothetical protein